MSSGNVSVRVSCYLVYFLQTRCLFRDRLCVSTSNLTSRCYFWISATEIVCAWHMWTFWLLFILSMVFSDLPLFSCGHLTHFTLHALASYASRTWNTCSAALYVWRTTIILSRSLSFRVHSTRDSSRQFRRGGEFRMHPGIAMPKNSWGPVEVFYCLYIKRMPQLAKTCLRAK